MNNILDAKQKSSYIRGMNKLPLKTRVQILSLLCEGVSLRAISRLCDVSINTVTKLLEDAGEFCTAFHDERVRGLTCKKVQVDEVWSFVYSKQANVPNAKAAPVDAGDVWTWTAIDADTKLIATWHVGDRTFYTAKLFLGDLKQRVSNRMQLTSDGYKAYVRAVSETFGEDIDYAVLQKLYGPSVEGARRYSPPECVGARKEKVIGNPSKADTSTSYAERQNLTMRMQMRRFTRLTNAFSKKMQNHAHMVAIYTVWYNWVRIHTSLRVTPAMAAGISDTLWSWEQIVEMMDAATPVKKRGPYKKTASV